MLPQNTLRSQGVLHWYRNLSHFEERRTLKGACESRNWPAKQSTSSKQSTSVSKAPQVSKVSQVSKVPQVCKVSQASKGLQARMQVYYTDDDMLA